MADLAIARRIRHSDVDAVLVNVQPNEQGARFVTHGPTPCKLATPRQPVCRVPWCSSAGPVPATYGIAGVGPPEFTKPSCLGRKPYIFLDHMKPLRCACLVNQRNETLLLVRVRQNEHWYLPGGKIEPQESAESALRRELAEELGIALVPESIKYLYSVVGPAYGQPGDVELICFSANWNGEPIPLGEITEVRWIDRNDTNKLAPAVRVLCTERLGHERAASPIQHENRAV